MSTGLDMLLWEDLSDVRSQTRRTLEALQSIGRAIEDGRVGQPNRQDSKRLNRLVALAELLSSESCRWAEELGLNKLTASRDENDLRPSATANGRNGASPSPH